MKELRSWVHKKGNVGGLQRPGASGTHVTAGASFAADCGKSLQNPSVENQLIQK
ncbi:hypothetical protein [Paracidovorax avenae]|uniref:hypothetical protein n=1 Tax=Paracidovorax avenae TaxID=80867 RepID=UPI001864EF2B|nr:hypothetical protein [Paracidovorax avenae]